MTRAAISILRHFLPKRDTEATINARRRANSRANFRAESRANPSTKTRPIPSRDLWDVPKVPYSAVRMAERILEGTERQVTRRVL